MVIMAFTVVGCSKTSRPETAGKVFDTAPAATKERWDRAVAAAKTNDYATAIINLRLMRTETQLTPKQAQVVEDTMTSVSAKMYEAFNRDEPGAQKAMEELRQFRGR